MSRGYTIHLYRLNSEADDASIGVRLGRMCIEKNIPAAEVATRLGVSRTTIYNWFGGAATPTSEFVEPITSFLAENE